MTTDTYRPVALVTGSSEGLGYAIAERLADDGFRTIVTSRRLHRAKHAVDALHAPGREVDSEQCDSCNPAPVGAMLARIVQNHGGLDVVVANAGSRVVGPIDTFDINDWRTAIEGNLLGTGVLATLTAPILRRSARARFIAVSSVSAIEGMPGRAPYAASKAGLHGLVRALAAELGPHGVTVNAVAPGLIAAGMGLRAAAEADDYLERLVAQIPIGRPGSAAEIGAVVAFLASGDSSYVTGQVLVVDGGWTACAPGAVPPRSVQR